MNLRTAPIGLFVACFLFSAGVSAFPQTGKTLPGKPGTSDTITSCPQLEKPDKSILEEKSWSLEFTITGGLGGGVISEIWINKSGTVKIEDGLIYLYTHAPDKTVAAVFPELTRLIEELPSKRDPWPVPRVPTPGYPCSDCPKMLLWIARRDPGPVWVDYVSVSDETGDRAATISKILKLVEQIRVETIKKEGEAR